jgi:hypothetical protein
VVDAHDEQWYIETVGTAGVAFPAWVRSLAGQAPGPKPLVVDVACIAFSRVLRVL